MSAKKGAPSKTVQLLCAESEAGSLKAYNPMFWRFHPSKTLYLHFPFTPSVQILGEVTTTVVPQCPTQYKYIYIYVPVGPCMPFLALHGPARCFEEEAGVVALCSWVAFWSLDMSFMCFSTSCRTSQPRRRKTYKT